MKKAGYKTNKAWSHFCYTNTCPCLFVCANECVSPQAMWQNLKTICEEWDYGYFNFPFILVTIIFKVLLNISRGIMLFLKCAQCVQPSHTTTWPQQSFVDIRREIKLFTNSSPFPALSLRFAQVTVQFLLQKLEWTSEPRDIGLAHDFFCPMECGQKCLWHMVDGTDLHSKPVA